jgi:hypothetical protein
MIYLANKWMSKLLSPRPLCEYPTWPKYDGVGDPNLASSALADICSPAI